MKQKQQKYNNVLFQILGAVFGFCRRLLQRFFFWTSSTTKYNDDDDDDDPYKTSSTSTVSSVSGGDPGTVKVYILLGQSNMLGMGHVHGVDKEGTLEHAVYKERLYPYLIVDSDNNDNDTKTDDHQWTVSPTVRNVRVMSAKGKVHVYNNEFMTIRGCDNIGPEFGIGHYLEKIAAAASSSSSGGEKQKQQQQKQPIMILKSCIGNRSLGWDLLPPGSQRYDYNDQTYAAYKESPAYWPKGQPKPDDPNPAWYAGKQYDTDIDNAKSVLNQLDAFYPNATKYSIEGFFWWQGDKDRYNEAYSMKYEQNLVRLINQLRSDFNAPDAKFVLATLGQDDINTVEGNDKLIFDAMMAVDGNNSQQNKYPDFVGNVTTVYSHPLSMGGSSNGHYNGDARTYMNIGEAMGKAMIEMMMAVSSKKTSSCNNDNDNDNDNKKQMEEDVV